jgi:hypothetical protein
MSLIELFNAAMIGTFARSLFADGGVLLGVCAGVILAARVIQPWITTSPFNTRWRKIHCRMDNVSLMEKSITTGIGDGNPLSFL